MEDLAAILTNQQILFDRDGSKCAPLVEKWKALTVSHDIK